MVRGTEAVAQNEGEVRTVSGDELFTIDTDSAGEIIKAIMTGIYNTSPGREYIDKLQESKGPGSKFLGFPTRGFLPAEGR